MKLLALSREFRSGDCAGATSRPRKSELARTRRLEAISGDRKGSATRGETSLLLQELSRCEAGGWVGRNEQRNL